MSKPRQFQQYVGALGLGNVFPEASIFYLPSLKSKLGLDDSAHLSAYRTFFKLSNLSAESGAAEFDSVQKDVHVYQHTSTVAVKSPYLLICFIDL